MTDQHLAVGVRASGTGSGQNVPRLTTVGLPSGATTDIPLDAEGASAFLFGGSVQWSPDGKRFAYTAANLDTGLFDVRVCNRDGSGITTILASTAPPGGPIWDQWAVYDWWPDGSALLISWTDVFVASGFGAGKIMKCAPDGSNLETLYDDPTGQHIGQANNNYLALSPDGSTIVAACFDNPPTDISTLRTMPSTGGPLSLLYDGSSTGFPPTLFLGCMGWKPGPKIAFMTHGPRIYTINGDGSDLELVSAGSWFSAVWASDTQLLVVQFGGSESLYLMELDGSATLVPTSPLGFWGGEKLSVRPGLLPGTIEAGQGRSGIRRRGRVFGTAGPAKVS